MRQAETTRSSIGMLILLSAWVMSGCAQQSDISDRGVPGLSSYATATYPDRSDGLDEYRAESVSLASQAFEDVPAPRPGHEEAR